MLPYMSRRIYCCLTQFFLEKICLLTITEYMGDAGACRYGDIRYSATENAVLCGSTIVALTQTELRLLSYMMKQPEKAYSREELLSAVWGFDSEVETRVTDETLRRIRKKLLQAGSTVSVSTIWGFGYKLKGAERT